MAKNKKVNRAVVRITVNGVTHNLNVNGGNNICVKTVNGITTVTINGVTACQTGVNGNSASNVNGVVTQTITTGVNNVVISNGTVVSSSTQRTASKPVTRAPRRTSALPKRASQMPRRASVPAAPSIAEIKNCFVELDQAYNMGAKDISEQVIIGVAGCKTVCKNATDAENSFKALKAKMSDTEYPIYTLSSKPKPSEPIVSAEGNRVNDGYCILSMPREVTYEGMIKDGKMCGYGSLISPAYSFAGDFNGNKEGQRGIYKEADGRELMISDGYGVFVKNNTLLAFGQIKGKKLNGYGIDLSDTENIKCGKFKNGEFLG